MKYLIAITILLVATSAMAAGRVNPFTGQPLTYSLSEMQTREAMGGGAYDAMRRQTFTYHQSLRSAMGAHAQLSPHQRMEWYEKAYDHPRKYVLRPIGLGTIEAAEGTKKYVLRPIGLGVIEGAEGTTKYVFRPVGLGVKAAGKGIGGLFK